LRNADALDSPTIDVLLDRAKAFLDRCFGIDTMEVVEREAINAKAL
jgi:hypothetical protein